METAVKVIAVCMVLRVVQNTLQLISMWSERDARMDAISEIVKRSSKTDKEFIEDLWKEYLRHEVGCDDERM